MDNLALFELEKERLLGLKPDLDVRPGVTAKAGKMTIILQWGLRSKNGVCPFLATSADGSKGCSIYDDRPMVCRAFPLSRSGLNGTDELISMDCPSAAIPFGEKEIVAGAEFFSKMGSYYGEVFDAAFRLDAARFWMRDMVKFVASRLTEAKNEQIGLLELAIREGIYDKEFLDREIKSLSSLRFSH
ncbi:Uncharacterised protein [uncultured archaeon]|nr:Uncharacterised protein [uncultured archaeon]